MEELSSPSPDNGDGHDPSTCDDSCGQMHDDWTSLPDAERRDYVLAEIEAGRWFGLLRQPVDDDLLDVIAAVRAINDENDEALAVIFANGNTGGMLITALKLLAEAAGDQGISPDFLAAWGSHALVRK